MLVMKFGGTSVADGRAIGRVVEIISRVPESRFVVVSALAGVTDKLVEAVRLAGDGHREAVVASVRAVRERHLDVAGFVRERVRRDAVVRELEREFDGLDQLLRALAVLREVTPRASDAVVGVGELVSSRLVAAALEEAGAVVRWLDARDLLVTDDRHGGAAPRLDDTAGRLRDHALPHLHGGPTPTVVVGGFVGATIDGVMTTLGRGGSDYSAAVFGACLDAHEIQIWTDVDGVLTADPRVVPHARPVARLSAAEAAELAYFGAKVLHPATIAPAVAADVPVRILNSHRPDVPGSLITAGPTGRAGPLAALACKRGVTMVDITSNRMLMAHGFLRRLFEVFERFETSIDVVTTSEVSVSVTLDERTRFTEIVQALEAFADVTSESGVAIICLVGEGLRDDPALAGAVLGALDGLAVRMVSQAAARRNLTVVLRDADLPSAMVRLHDHFFERERAAVRADGAIGPPTDKAAGSHGVLT